MYNVLKFSEKWWHNVKQSIYRNRNATANFVNLIRTSTVRNVSRMNIKRTHLSLPIQFQPLHVFITKRVKTPDLGRHCLFLHKADFRRWRHIFKSPVYRGTFSILRNAQTYQELYIYIVWILVRNRVIRLLHRTQATVLNISKLKK